MSFWTRHQIFEKNSIVLVAGILVVIAIGGLVEITPLFYLKSTIEKVDGIRPYTPLELAGRNIYVREGCYVCHSQQVRALRDDYDFIFVDSPPSLGLLTLNALVAADSVLVPLNCEYFALEGIAELMSTIERVKENLNPDLALEGVLLTMYDERTNLGQQVSANIREYFGDRVYKTVIPRNIRLGEAPSHGVPVILYDARSRGAEAYVTFAHEFAGRRSMMSPAVAAEPIH